MRTYQLLNDLFAMPEDAVVVDVAEGDRACVRSKLYRFTEILPLSEAVQEAHAVLERDSHIYTRIMVHLNDGAEWDGHYGKLIRS